MTPSGTHAEPPADRVRSRRRIWTVVKWTLCVVVIAFVARRAWDLWDRDDLAGVRISIPWLCAAAVVYAAGWLPSVWFWRRLMRDLGSEVSFRDAARAYYCGHLGKYIPGKATVIVIRAALLKGRGASPAVAGVTATFETLAVMGTGAAVGAALAPAVLAPWFGDLSGVMLERPWLPLAALAIVVAVLLPLLSRISTLLLARFGSKHFGSGERAPAVNTGVLFGGFVAFVAGWWLQGLSLGFVLRSVSDTSFDLTDWPLWTAAAAFATSIGFAVLFAPGGVGVREGLLIEMLSAHPEIGGSRAVAAALLMRMVSLASEVALAAALYYMGRRSPLSGDPATDAVDHRPRPG